MIWETKTFEELYLEPSRNGIYKPKEFHGRGCKIVNMGELFAYDFVGRQDMKRVELNEKELERDTLKEGDILFGRRSLVESGAGKSSIVKNLNEPTTCESSVIRLRLNKKHSNPYFYYYWLLSPSGKGAIASIVTGANVKGIKSSDLKNIVVPTPPLPTQNKIVGILSAYDDLIENNLKRIKLLEEMAQITYEEWFVRLRFPGHESTPINPETGLPEGWRQKQLADYFPIKTGKKDANIQAPDGQYPFFTCSQDTYRTDVYSFDAEAIILAGNGEFNIKYYRGKFEAYQRNYVLIPNDRNFLFLLFLFMKHYLYQITAGSKGAVIKYLTKDMIANTKFQEPTISVLTAFNDITVPVFYEIENLEKQNQRLREARDILLPRLMTGVIDVESYDPAQLLKEAA